MLWGWTDGQHFAAAISPAVLMHGGLDSRLGEDTPPCVPIALGSKRLARCINSVNLLMCHSVAGTLFSPVFLIGPQPGMGPKHNPPITPMDLHIEDIRRGLKY